MSEVALKNLAEIERNGVAPEKIGGGTRYLGLEHIESGGRILGSETVETGDLASTKFRFTPDHLLFGKLRPYLAKIALPDFAGICSTDILPVRPGPELDRRYLAFFLRQPSIVDLASSRATGANLPRLSPKALGEIEIPWRPLPEQRRIAAILAQADALRCLRRQSLSHLSDLGQAIFFKMFGDVAANSRRWDERHVLNDVAYVSSGITKGRKANGKVMREVPYLAVSNVQDGQVRLDVVKTIEATDAEIQRYALQPNDIVLTEGGDPDKLGRGGIWRGEIAECIHQNHVFRVRLTDPDMRPLFLSRLIGSERGKRYFLRSAKQTTGIASINMTQLKNFPLLSPPNEIQLEFEANMGRLNKEMKRAKLAYEASEHLFASLQHRAFRGEL